MLKRYLGNKTELISEIRSSILENVPLGGRVGDFFSGSLSVAMALKVAGYDVVSNDINYFSYVFGEAYLANNHIPVVNITDLVPSRSIKVFEAVANNRLQLLKGQQGYKFLKDKILYQKYHALATVLCFLESSEEALPSGLNNNYIFNTYCELGKNSAFTSSRGTSGKRKFFSPSNAKRIDFILNNIRHWKSHGLINHTLYAILISVLIRSVEKISNTQGTYHDFPRDKYDPRALVQLKLELPPFDDVLVGGNHIIGKAEDSLKFSLSTPELDCLYLDPPYNFRQYTSYYFLPNVLAKYCEIDDLDSYFSKVQYVRGQNMDDDFVSTFCKKSQFINSLKELIIRSSPKVVVLSYFNGTNHWNKFKSECNGEGYEELMRLFESDLFLSESLQVKPIQRTNYQSYGGHRAKQIDEYLFIGHLNQGLNYAMA